jgi:uncharacterized membrane protein/mono/diheme cytochrome c family protein
MHPLLVHLPIGMIFLLAVLEAAALFPRLRNAAVNAGFILAVAAPLAVVTAVCGWLLSLAGGYDESLLAWHKWLGIATALGIVLAAILFWRRHFASYRAVLFVAVFLLMAAGHLGGSLTHGSDYLIRYAPGPLKKLLGVPDQKPAAKLSEAELRQLPMFTGIIEPIFESKCVVCHGPKKSKAKLRLDSFSALQDGSENGAVYNPGHATESPLVQRLLLPASHDDHMPPAGKPQLTVAEIQLVKWWVDIGAPETNTLNQLQPPLEILAALLAK